MAIVADTHVMLGVSSPKKSATVATGALTLAANSMAIKVGSSVDAGNVQAIIGDIEKLYRFALTRIAKVSGTTTVSIIPGKGDSGIVLTGHGAGLVTLYIHADILANNKSHFLHRTYKRLVERLLEEAK